MSYFVTVTFDIKAPTSNAYEEAGTALGSLGFSNTIKGTSDKQNKLPNTTYVGEFNGSSASKVRDDLCTQISQAFTNKNLKATIFVTIGGDWSWGIRYS